MYYVYILRCADSSLYLGSAQNVNSRIKAHIEGRGAAYTFKHRPVRLVYSGRFLSETAVAPIWELRVGEYRVFYDVSRTQSVVYVRAVRRKPRGTKTEDIL